MSRRDLDGVRMMLQRRIAALISSSVNSTSGSQSAIKQSLRRLASCRSKERSVIASLTQESTLKAQKLAGINPAMVPEHKSEIINQKGIVTTSNRSTRLVSFTICRVTCTRYSAFTRRGSTGILSLLMRDHQPQQREPTLPALQKAVDSSPLFEGAFSAQYLYSL